MNRQPIGGLDSNMDRLQLFMLRLKTLSAVVAHIIIIINYTFGVDFYYNMFKSQTETEREPIKKKLLKPTHCT